MILIVPSIIANIFGGYEQSINLSRNRFEQMRSKRQGNAQKFYEDFCYKLIRDYSAFGEDAKIRGMKTEIQRFFNDDKITFAAVDGTNYKQKMEDYMIFFGGAYAVKGEINFQDSPPRTRYKKWSSKEDVSMVAYVPIPYADLNDISEDQFIMIPDKERFDLLSIDTKLMQLAEIFLLYTIIDNPNYHPDFVIWDHSMSGVMASNELVPEVINMVDNIVMGSKINYQDVVIAFSHPHNESLDIPEMRHVEPYNYILRKLMKDRSINLSEVESEQGIKKEIILNKIRKYLLRSPNDEGSIATLENDILSINPKWLNSWSNSITFFKNFCQRLFNEKDSSVLIYERFAENDEKREHWISPTDLTYLIAIGIRAVTELAWQNKVMLVGIVKDSASTYFSQKYLGTMRHIGAPDYTFEDVLLPWSDRLFLQALPQMNDAFNSPWSTIEFDSVFMTLHVQRGENGAPEIVGVKGNILNNERLFFSFFSSILS